MKIIKYYKTKNRTIETLQKRPVEETGSNIHNCIDWYMRLKRLFSIKINTNMGLNKSSRKIILLEGKGENVQRE